MSFGFSISDFITVGDLAFRLYRDCFQVARGAPQEFQQLRVEIATLSSSLRLLRDEAENPDSGLAQAGEDRVLAVNNIVKGIEITLKELERAAIKYKVLGSETKSKRSWAVIWTKVKWSIEFADLDALRSKLIYHNGAMTLVLAAAGNSSLERLLLSNKALEDDVKSIKSYLSNLALRQPTNAPSISAAENSPYQHTFRAILMRNAEILQPWKTIGVDTWIEAGRWWLMKSQMEIHAAPIAGQPISLTAYANLLKSSWIITDVITHHPQISFVSGATDQEIRHLSAGVKSEFSTLSASRISFPDLSELRDQNLQIWEATNKGPTLRPHRNARSPGDWLIQGDERVVFQAFANCKLQSRTASFPCIVFYLVQADVQTTRLVAQNQEGVTLMIINIEEIERVEVKSETTIVNNEKLTFHTSEDAQILQCMVEGSWVYLDRQAKTPSCLTDLEAFMLCVAVKNQFKDVVLRLLQKSSIKEAASKPNPEACAQLIAHDIALKYVRGQLDDLQSLLQKDAYRPRRFDFSQHELSLFWWTIFCGHHPVFQILRAEHALTGYDDRWDGFSPLGIAACFGHENVAQGLLSIGADCNALDGHGYAPMHHACSNGKKQLVELFLKSGARVDQRESCGNSSLHLALIKGHREIIGLLLTWGADIEARDEKLGNTAIMLAARQGCHKTVQRLLEKGANIEAKSIHGDTALIEAARGGYTETVQVLLEGGADIEAKDISAETALTMAACGGMTKVVQILLESGADLEAKGISGATALIMAARPGREALILLLLDMGANPVATDNYGIESTHKLLDRILHDQRSSDGDNGRDNDSDGIGDRDYYGLPKYYAALATLLSKACSFRRGVPCVASKFTQPRRAEIILTIIGGLMILFLDSHHAYLELSDFPIVDDDPPEYSKLTCRKKLLIQAKREQACSVDFCVIHQEEKLDFSYQYSGGSLKNGTLQIINGGSRNIKGGDILMTNFPNPGDHWVDDRSVTSRMHNIELDPNAEIVEPELSNEEWLLVTSKPPSEPSATL